MSEKPTTEKNLKTSSGAESPTTARELDFDDDQETSHAAEPTAQAPAATKTVTFQEETPPPKPPRPMSAQQQAETTLKEAFPSTDEKVIRAVLLASGGQVEPAFNALLSMSDPNFKGEEAPPPQPRRPANAARSQLEQDELYARQLAEHYQSQSSAYDGYGSRTRGDPPTSDRRYQESGLKPNELYDDRERSFFDDDLPVIKQNIQKGFLETQTKVNKWISDFKKKIDGEDEEDEFSTGQGGSTRRQNFGPSQSQQLYGIRKSAEMRRSGDRERYDADPHVLGDDFASLEMHDNEAPPPKPRRPLANPDLFKPTPTAPQSGPVDEVEALYRQPSPSNQQKSPEGGKTKKWQPLTSVAPNPEVDDHDPFSLGDSDDEDNKTKDIKAEDTDRLKKAAADVPEDKSASSGPKPEAAERSGSLGTRDKAAEELLAGKETKP